MFKVDFKNTYDEVERGCFYTVMVFIATTLVLVDDNLICEFVLGWEERSSTQKPTTLQYFIQFLLFMNSYPVSKFICSLLTQYYTVYGGNLGIYPTKAILILNDKFRFFNNKKHFSFNYLKVLRESTRIDFQSLTRWPIHLSPTQNMQVQMIHTLA